MEVVAVRAVSEREAVDVAVAPAVLVRDRDTFRRIWTEPVFDPSAPRRAADSEQKSLDRAAATAAIEAALAGPRTIYVGVSSCILDMAEKAWKEHELPVVRFEGMDLGRRIDAATIMHALLEASSYREDRTARGLIIIDNLERALEYLEGRYCVEELFRPRAWSIDFQTRIDSSKIRVIAAMGSLSDAKDRALLVEYAVLRIADVCRHDLAN